MAALASAYLTLEKLEEIVNTLKAKQQKGVNVTININDESKSFKTKNGNDIFQNVSIHIEQNKEEKEAKKPKYYLGNGGVFWTDGKIAKAGASAQQNIQQQQTTPQSAPSASNLPF